MAFFDFLNRDNQKLKDTMADAYGSDLSPAVPVKNPPTQKTNHAKEKAKKNFDRCYKKFSDNAFQLKQLLEKERYSKNPERQRLANETNGNLEKLSIALDKLKNANGDASVIATSINDINTHAAALKKQAPQYNVSKGRKIAGVLMIVTGIAMMAASSALAFFSAGLALPVSIPLAGAGLALSTAGGATLFTRSRIHRKIDKVIDMAECTVKKFSATKRQD